MTAPRPAPLLLEVDFIEREGERRVSLRVHGELAPIELPANVDTATAMGAILSALVRRGLAAWGSET